MGSPVKYAPAVLAAALLVAGCSSDNKDLPDLGPSITMSPPAANAGVPDSAKLMSALLTESELPVGFGALADPSIGPSAAQPSPTKASTNTDPPECAAVLEPIADVSPGATGRALGRFQGTDFSSIDIDAASYSPSTVADAFAHVQDVFAKCTEYSDKDGDGVKISFTLARLDRPKSGDSSVSIRLQTESEGVTLTSDVVVMVVGTTIVQFAATGTSPIAPQVLTDLVDKQATKIRDIK